MNHRHTIRSLRWFFLVWLGIVYLRGLVGISFRGLSTVGAVKPQTSDKGPSLLQLLQALAVSWPAAVTFTILLLGSGVLLWVSLSRHREQRFKWFSFPIQGLLPLIVAFIVPGGEVVPILYLILALEAVAILKQAYLIFLVSCSSVILFMLVVITNLRQWESTWPFAAMQWGFTWPLTIWNLFGLVALLLFVAGYLVLYMHMIRSHTQLEAAHQELASTHAQLQESAEQMKSLSRLTERQRLARELHDTLAQGLAGLIMQLQVAHLYQTEHHYERTQAIIQQAILRARTALSEARQTIDDLRSEPGHIIDLMQTVQEEMDHFTQATGIACEADLAGLSAIPPSLREHALRAITEGLMNVARHARARHAWMRAVKCERTIEIEIGDDGIGFDPSVMTTHPGHYGLLGLYERARLARGEFHISSAPGAGTTLRFCLPSIEEVLCGEDDPYHDR